MSDLTSCFVISQIALPSDGVMNYSRADKSISNKVLEIEEHVAEAAKDNGKRSHRTEASSALWQKRTAHQSALSAHVYSCATTFSTLLSL